MARSSNLLFAMVGALVVVAGVLGYMVYEDRRKPDGVQINVGPAGVSIEKK